MAVLVIADHDGSTVRETTHKTVTAASKLGGGDGLVGGFADGGAVVIGDDENGHYSTPAVLSLATRSAASVTFTPAPRFGGSLTLVTFRRGATSTP